MYLNKMGKKKVKKKKENKLVSCSVTCNGRGNRVVRGTRRATSYYGRYARTRSRAVRTNKLDLHRIVSVYKIYDYFHLKAGLERFSATGEL